MRTLLGPLTLALLRPKAVALMLVLAAGLVLQLTTPAEAADPRVVDMQLDPPQRLTVGDRVPVQIRVEADAGTNVTLLQGSLPPEVEIADPPHTTSRSVGNGRVELTFSFEIVPFVTGDVVIPPIVLRYVQQGAPPAELQTAPSRLSVASVLPPGDTQPRDLKPQSEIAASGSGWIAPAAAAALALALVLGLIVWRVRALSRRPVASPIPLAPAELAAEDRARAALDRTGARFAQDDDYIAYYSAIAATARGYLTERFGFPAFALTTTELQSAMLRAGIDRWQVRVTSGLLQQCDSVVYARYRPAHERADADLTAAYEIVEMSRPVPEPVEALAT